MSQRREAAQPPSHSSGMGERRLGRCGVRWSLVVTSIHLAIIRPGVALDVRCFIYRWGVAGGDLASVHFEL